MEPKTKFAYKPQRLRMHSLSGLAFPNFRLSFMGTLFRCEAPSFMSAAAIRLVSLSHCPFTVLGSSAGCKGAGMCYARHRDQRDAGRHNCHVRDACNTSAACDCVECSLSYLGVTLFNGNRCRV